jgi:hypothetical protein
MQHIRTKLKARTIFVFKSVKSSHQGRPSDSTEPTTLLTTTASGIR